MKNQKSYSNQTSGLNLTKSLFRKKVQNQSIVKEEKDGYGEYLLYGNSFPSYNENLQNKIIGMSVLEIIS
jgi:hypothetical protein